MTTGEADGSKRIAFDFTVTVSHANYPFPPNFELLEHSKTDLANEGGDTVTFTETNWGAGKDCYVIGLILDLRGATEWNVDRLDGVLVNLARVADSAFILREMFKESPVFLGGKYVQSFTRSLAIPRRVASGESLVSAYSNESGQTLTFTGWIAYFTES